MPVSCVEVVCHLIPPQKFRGRTTGELRGDEEQAGARGTRGHLRDLSRQGSRALLPAAGECIAKGSAKVDALALKPPPGLGVSKQLLDCCPEGQHSPSLSETEEIILPLVLAAVRQSFEVAV